MFKIQNEITLTYETQLNMKIGNYICELCLYETDRKANYERHMQSFKHLKKLKSRETNIQLSLIEELEKQKQEIERKMLEEIEKQRIELEEKKRQEELERQQAEEEKRLRIELEKQKEKEEKKKKKQAIPKNVRNIVWNHYIGEDIIKHRCLCCKKVLITNTNFEVGHVLSEKNGGTHEINNLRPICGSCNHSMGIENMVEFVVKYGLYIG